MENTDFNPDPLKYSKWQKRQLNEWEEKCLRCGACCGIFDKDHCEHLIKTKEGKYACSEYENRLGLHKTRKGKNFKCVPIRNILHETWLGEMHCAYKNKQLKYY